MGLQRPVPPLDAIAVKEPVNPDGLTLGEMIERYIMDPLPLPPLEDVPEEDLIQYTLSALSELARSSTESTTSQVATLASQPAVKVTDLSVSTLLRLRKRIACTNFVF